MIKCPDCGSTEYCMAARDMTISDQTDFCCLNCGCCFFVSNGKIYSEKDFMNLKEKKDGE